MHFLQQVTQALIKTLVLKVYIPVNVIHSFLIIFHPISYTPLNDHVKFYNMKLLYYVRLLSFQLISYKPPLINLKHFLPVIYLSNI